MAVDGTMRPLNIPPKFISYLESHHIYYTFYVMCIHLIKYRPDDVITFMKLEFQEFQNQLRTTNRVIIIAPDHLNLNSFASELASLIHGIVVSLEDVVKEYNIQENDEEPIYDPKALANATKRYIAKKVQLKSWVLIGFPRTREEGIALQREGVLPTNTLELCHTPKDYAVDDLWNENLSGGGAWTYETYRDMLVRYKRRARDLREVFRRTHRKIIIRGRRREKLVNDCVDLLYRFRHIGAPLLPRVVLIGPRGSRRKTLASMLMKRFKFVHVNYQAILAREAASKGTAGDIVRQTQNLVENINADISLKILEDRLLEKDCLTHGWVLTGFPNDETDFRMLDSIQTPPNRVIILDICSEPCLERLEDRLINMFSGEVMSKKNTSNEYSLAQELATHPNTYKPVVMADQERYASEIQDLIDYCEYKAEIIDANGSLAEVFEKIERIVIYPLPMDISRRIEPSQSLYNQFQYSDTDVGRMTDDSSIFLSKISL